MKNLIIVSIFCVSGAACSSLPKGTLEMENRYVKERRESLSVPKNISKRKYQSVEKVRVGGRFLKSGDWFHGAYVSLVVSEKDYVFDDPVLKKIRKGK